MQLANCCIPTIFAVSVLQVFVHAESNSRLFHPYTVRISAVPTRIVPTNQVLGHEVEMSYKTWT